MQVPGKRSRGRAATASVLAEASTMHAAAHNLDNLGHLPTRVQSIRPTLPPKAGAVVDDTVASAAYAMASCTVHPIGTEGDTIAPTGTDDGSMMATAASANEHVVGDGGESDEEKDGKAY